MLYNTKYVILNIETEHIPYLAIDNFSFTDM